MIQTTKSLIVQKYGGSSLSSIDKVNAVAQKIVASAAGGRPIVVVVSAMGNTTSELIERAHAVSDEPPRRELDMLLSSGERMSMALLAMAIESLGRQAISLTGPQSGIATDGDHTNATITQVEPRRITRELAAGKIVIVAGYQGEGPNGEVTTLGRGGSDTTALALAGALNAERCEIYSDVNGVYTADPRLVDGPMHLERVDAELMVEYALRGARVLHPASVAFAHRHEVPLHALSTFGDDGHTVISSESGLSFSRESDGDPQVVGVTSRKARLRMRGAAEALRTMEPAFEQHGCSAEEILRRTAKDQHDYLLDLDDLPDPEGASERIARELHGKASVTDALASVSIVATASHVATLAGQVEQVLAEAGAPAVATYRRPLSVTCAVPADDRAAAVRALHESLVEAPLALTS